MVNYPRSLLRIHGQQTTNRVSSVELFFDLVFVFAVTQLSHTLLSHLTLGGTMRALLLLVAIWWVWIYTTWVTNWLDPDRIPVRICLFVLMLAGLLMSVSIPQAFAERGMLFAGSYVFMQVGRSLFFLWAVRGEPINLSLNFQRILVWLALSGIFWVIGGFADNDTRLVWWALALLIELVAPALYFWVPGLGRSRMADWNIAGGHMAERCSLFVIIALGESLLVTGASFAESEWNIGTVTGLLIAVLGSVAMWWVYFDTGAERASRRIERSSDPGRQARLAYTYLHALIVAGIIVSAAADEMVLMHSAHTTTAGVFVIFGGPLLYLLGNALFKWVTNDRRTPPLSHMVGLVVLAAVQPIAIAGAFPTLALSAMATGVLILVAGWESLALRSPMDKKL